MGRNLTDTLRGSLKAALASTISRAHGWGLAAALARTARRPLILGYHRVVEDFDAIARREMPSMLISRTMFERHVDHIGRRFRFVTLDEIGARMLAGEPFTHPVAAITFDDGYQDIYEHAFPLLKRKGIPAAVFVVTDLVGRPFWQIHDKLYHLIAKAFATWQNPRYELRLLCDVLDLPVDLAGAPHATRTPLLAVSVLLPALSLGEVRRLIDGLEAAVGNGFYNVPRTLTWPMLAEMRRAGFTIGSHTKNHVSLPMESADVVVHELEGSRQAIERHLGEPVVHFAYPGGQFTRPVVDAVVRAGYQYAYTACPHGDPRRPALTIERLLLWERSSVGADGRFLPSILDCQVNDLWPPARTCGRTHRSAAAERACTR